MPLLAGVLSDATRLAIDNTGNSIAHFFNPGLPPIPHTHHLFLMSLTDALTLAAGYTAFVLGALLYRRVTSLRKKNSTSSEREISYSSLSEKLRAEPILIAAAFYNLCQVVLCSWMVYKTVCIAKSLNYKLVCNAFDAEAREMANIVHKFYLSKALDFVDTLLIISRGKWRQLSFLHAYHHISVFLIYWLNLASGYDGDVYFTVVLNGAIHAIMYSYYLARILNIPVPILLKQCVTHAQKVQFIAMNLQALSLVHFNCPYPQRLTWLYFVYIVSLLALFQDFANKEYGKKKLQTDRGMKGGSRKTQ